MAKTPANSPVDDGSTPKPQTEANVHPDTGTHPSEADLKAVNEQTDKVQAPDPLLAKDEGIERGLPGTDPSVEGEIEVKARDAVVLMDPFTGRHFSNDAVTKTPRTEFVTRRLDSGELIEA